MSYTYNPTYVEIRNGSRIVFEREFKHRVEEFIETFKGLSKDDQIEIMDRLDAKIAARKREEETLKAVKDDIATKSGIESYDDFKKESVELSDIEAYGSIGKSYFVFRNGSVISMKQSGYNKSGAGYALKRSQRLMIEQQHTPYEVIITLSSRGVTRKKRVAYIVANAFMNKAGDKELYLRYKDNDPNNCSLDNLERVTREEYINGRECIPVIGTSLEGTVTEYYSLEDAETKTGIAQEYIVASCSSKGELLATNSKKGIDGGISFVYKNNINLVAYLQRRFDAMTYLNVSNQLEEAYAKLIKYNE